MSLEIEPKLRTRIKSPAEQNGSLCRDSAFAVNNRGNAIWRHAKRESQAVRADPKRHQELLFQDFTRVNEHFLVRGYDLTFLSDSL